MVFGKFGLVVHYSALVNRFSQKMGEPEHFQQTKMPAIARAQKRQAVLLTNLDVVKTNFLVQVKKFFEKKELDF